MTPARIEYVDQWRPRELEPVRIGVIESPDSLERTTADLAREFPAGQMKFNPIYAPNYAVHVVECFAPPVNKWYGITQVARQIGISARQIVAIGDDVNDLEMIRGAGLGVAMANAIEKIKAAARWHAPSQDHAGVAATIEALLPGDLDPLAQINP